MYDGVKTRINTVGGDLQHFLVVMGLHQGSTLTLFLFALVMDVLMRKIQGEMMETDDGMVEETWYAATIQPPPVQGNAIFHVNNTMLHLLNKKSLFGGLPTDDPNGTLRTVLGCVPPTCIRTSQARQII
ncbi:uncharacterized protein LOC132639506 [Lycium barbarum]|uniref:uncharacterized protein LOC132639506 n=1 Tax=Lycium barbarum TaxID=112863 RepID=UPI00293E9CD5|nr:uncharacterized protein LOC132639506 [Lycium barbarum]